LKEILSFKKKNLLNMYEKKRDLILKEAIFYLFIFFFIFNIKKNSKKGVTMKKITIHFINIIKNNII